MTLNEFYEAMAEVKDYPESSDGWKLVGKQLRSGWRDMDGYVLLDPVQAVCMARIGRVLPAAEAGKALGLVAKHRKWLDLAADNNVANAPPGAGAAVARCRERMLEGAGFCRT